MLRLPRRRASTLAGLLAVLVIGGTALAGASSAATSGSHVARTVHWHVVKEWTFRHASDLHDWTPSIGNAKGWDHKQRQYYIPSDAWTSKIGLVMQATKKGAGKYDCWYGPCTYTSARLQSSGFSQEYGLIEARIKLASGGGLWPAFWMEGVDADKVGWPGCGELDAIETNMKHPEIVQGFAHATKLFKEVQIRLHSHLSAHYHTYAIHWTPKEIWWLIDGRAYGHLKMPGAGKFHQKFFFILQFAVGGTWPGSPPKDEPFPRTMVVDWVKVLTKS
jgi:beta-glucanase (GH16 family)